MSTYVRCQTCGASLTFEGAQRSTTCPYCASPAVLERAASAAVAPARFALGFTVPREAAVARVRAWARSGLFRHSGLEHADVETLRGLYVPAWLYSAVASADFSASIGENYTVRRTRTVTRNGRTTTQTYTTTETEWRPLQGRFVGYVADVLVTASRGLSNTELAKLEPFDLRFLTRYVPGMIAGFGAEDVTLPGDASAQYAREEAAREVHGRLAAFMPGDRHRDLRSELRVHDEAADVVLLPVWVFAVRHAPEKPPLRVLVNGQTGQVVGDKPLAWWKIALAIVALVVVLAGVVGLAMWLGEAR